MKPQLVIPRGGDPYYNTKGSGGYSPCIQGNPQRRVKDLNVLPNCVGYSVGRFNEIGDYGECKYLGNTNACNFVSLALSQRLKISQDPVLGGCMVWKGGQGGFGHVAIVEILHEDGSVTTSESEYYGKAFITYHRGGANFRSGCYWMDSSYTYLGCIVNPAVQPKEPDMTKPETEALIRDMFPDLMAAYLKDQAQKPADDWAQPAIDYCTRYGVMVGDPDGNFRPQSPIKREEVAVVVKALLAE